jgi:hypothetical protein
MYSSDILIARLHPHSIYSFVQNRRFVLLGFDNVLRLEANVSTGFSQSLLLSLVPYYRVKEQAFLSTPPLERHYRIFHAWFRIIVSKNKLFFSTPPLERHHRIFHAWFCIIVSKNKPFFDLGSPVERHHRKFHPQVLLGRVYID